MVQAFDAGAGDGTQITEIESTSARFIGEVIDFVQEHKAITAIAGISLAAGTAYLSRAPIGRFLSRCGGSLWAAPEAVGAAAKIGESPWGRQIAVSSLKTDSAILAAARGEETIVSGVKTAGATKKPLLEALDEAVKSGQVKTAPEPWAYHPEHRGLLLELSKGGSDLRSAGQSAEALGTVTSTHTPDATEIARMALAKHKFLTGK